MGRANMERQLNPTKLRKSMRSARSKTTQVRWDAAAPRPVSKPLLDSAILEGELAKPTMTTTPILRLSAHMHIFEPFPHDAFYVRACFEDCYDYIAGQSDTTHTRGFNVFGPPGVGTSVFMAHFFLRFTPQYPTNTFVLISYDDDRHFKTALV